MKKQINRWKQKQQNKNKKVGKEKSSAICLAIIVGCFSWLYTYKYNAWKFWVGLAIIVVAVIIFSTEPTTPFIFGLSITIWAIIDNAIKPKEFYEDYYID